MEKMIETRSVYMEIWYMRGDIPTLGEKKDGSMIRTICYPYEGGGISNSYNASFSKVSFRGVKDLYMKGKCLILIFIQRNIDNQVENNIKIYLKSAH